jgi:nicotinamidase/pyrazinamidase
VYIPEFKTGDALLVVDLQNDFCPGGALGIHEGDRVIPILNKYIAAAQQQGIPVFASRDWHPANHVSFKARGGPWPVHCVQNSPGAEFHPEVRLPLDVQVISKAHTPDLESYSAFGETNLSSLLRAKGIRRLWIGGLAQDYCVLQTSLDALKQGFEVVVIVEATRAVDVHDGKRALEQIRSAGGVLQESVA